MYRPSTDLPVAGSDSCVLPLCVDREVIVEPMQPVSREFVKLVSYAEAANALPNVFRSCEDTNGAKYYDHSIRSKTHWVK